MIERSDVTAVLLAGGRGRRMGGVDKGWMMFDGEPLVRCSLSALSLQVDRIAISANRNIGRYRRLGYPVVADSLADYPGPLAGALSAMQVVSTPWTLLAPVDMPWLPTDMVQRLAGAVMPRDSGDDRGPCDIAVAHDGQRLQPLVALLRTSLRWDLGEWLTQGDGKVVRWYDRHRWCQVDFSDVAQRFVNLNTPDEHQRAQSRHDAPTR